MQSVISLIFKGCVFGLSLRLPFLGFNLNGRRRDLFPFPDNIIKSDLSRIIRRRTQIIGAENERMNKTMNILNLI